jgi:hypothetical protein
MFGREHQGPPYACPLCNTPVLGMPPVNFQVRRIVEILANPDILNIPTPPDVESEAELKAAFPL